MDSQVACADLEIRILSGPKSAQGKPTYRVELTLDYGQEFGPAEADLHGMGPCTAFASAEREKYGVELFERLFASKELKAAWDRIRGQTPARRIRLRIDFELAELHELTWELLRDPQAGPGGGVASSSSTPFSRYLAQALQPGNAVLKRPIRVLVAIANPPDLPAWKLSPIDPEPTFQELVAAADVPKDEDGNPLVQFELLPQPCTLDAIRDRLKLGYHILHFIGHGQFGDWRDRHGNARKLAALLMSDPAGAKTPDEADNAAGVTEDRIGDMLGNLLADAKTTDEDRLRLVFLESCDTAKRDSSDAFRGLAPTLVNAGVPAVIAMQGLVEIKTARKFAATFYRQLVRHGQVDLASNEARDAVQAEKLRDPELPVLFMRLRSGELLRTRGRIATGASQNFWPMLVANIQNNVCIPFLGPRVNDGILPRSDTLARVLAKTLDYPFDDAGNLVRVAQYCGYLDPEAFRRTHLEWLKRGLYRSVGRESETPAPKALAAKSVSQLASELDWGGASREIQESRIYHLLADFDLPLYITTNADSFMYEALKSRPHVEARRAGPQWSASSQPYALTPAPGNTTPYVFHLNGYDDDAAPEQLAHIALSEDEFLEAFVRLARDQTNIIPSNVVEVLATSSYLFLGYGIDDWEFRVLMQGLLQPIAKTRKKHKLHVGVQLDAGDATAGLDEGAVRRYLERYLADQFRITVYWGTPSQFVAEMHQRYRGVI
jgi:hypothetical protein